MTDLSSSKFLTHVRRTVYARTACSKPRNWRYGRIIPDRSRFTFFSTIVFLEAATAPCPWCEHDGTAVHPASGHRCSRCKGHRTGLHPWKTGDRDQVVFEFIVKIGIQQMLEHTDTLFLAGASGKCR